MADNTTELEVLDEIVDVLGGQSGQYETVVPVLQQIKELLAAGITDPEAIAEAVAAWLDEHPEATTTVQDGSITGVKIANDTIPDTKLAQTGVKSDVGRLLGRTTVALEMGNITYNPASWSYSSSTARVRVPDGSEIALAAGSVISLSDYANYTMYVAWKVDGTPKGYLGWLTSDFVTPEDADYSILVRKNPEASITVDNVRGVLTVTSNGELSIPIVYDALANDNLFAINDATDGYINSNGTLTPLHPNNEMVSDYIPVSEGEEFCITDAATVNSLASGYALWMSACFFDDSLSRVGSVAIFSNNIVGHSVMQKVVTAPSGAAYLRVSARMYDDGYVRVVRGKESPAAVFCGLARDTSRVITTKNVKYLEQPFAKLILGVDGNYVDVDTNAKTLTIPRDTILITGNRNGVYTVLNISESVTISYASIGSSAVKFVYSPSTAGWYALAYTDGIRDERDVIVAVGRLPVSGVYAAPSLSCTCAYRIDGAPFGISVPDAHNVASVNHRGYIAAPENTLPAFRLSSACGFKHVECDVQFTSDGVAVLLHDESINRTARNADGTTISGTVNIADITYDEALEYDFGVYKHAKYAGTTIPTFEQFVTLCRNLGLRPYIELKAGTQEQVEGLVDVVAACGMSGKVSWISFNATLLGYVEAYDEKARLGYVVGSVNATAITTAAGLKTTGNEVFIDSSTYTSAEVELCVAAGIPLEVWTINSAATIEALPTYVSGVTSDSLIAGRVLYVAGMSEGA